MVVSAAEVLMAPAAEPGSGSTAHPAGSVSVFTTQEVCSDNSSVAAQAGPIWVTGDDHRQLTEAALMLRGSGGGSADIVLECPPGLVRELVATGHVVAVCPDDLGAQPGGALEAVVVEALVNGATFVRTAHALAARRCMDVTSALITEKAGADL